MHPIRGAAGGEPPRRPPQQAGRSLPSIANIQGGNLQPQTQSPAFDFSNADHEILVNIPYAMQRFGFRYNGSLHSKWAKELHTLIGKGNRIPVTKKAEYLSLLLPSLPTIQNWTDKFAINFYICLRKISFFHRVEELDAQSQHNMALLEQAILSKINNSLDAMTLTAQNSYTYIGLILSVSMFTDTAIAEKSRLLREILTKLTKAFLFTPSALNFRDFKQILNCIVTATKNNNEYKGFMQPLVEMILHQLGTRAYLANENDDVVSCFCTLATILSNDFPLTPALRADFYNLLARLQFDTCEQTASEGFEAIAKLIDKEVVVLDPMLDSKIESMMAFISRLNLSLKSCSTIAHSITRIAYRTRVLPDKVRPILDACLIKLTTDLSQLTAEQISSLLMTVTNLAKTNVAIDPLFKKIISEILRIKNNILAFNYTEMNIFISELAELMSRNTANLDHEFINTIKPFFAELFLKYAEFVYSGKLNTIFMCKGFVALSTIIRRCFLADQTTQHLLNFLFHQVNQNFANLNITLAADFLHNTFSVQELIPANLMTFDDYVGFFCHLTPANIQTMSAFRQTTLLWSMMAFVTANEHSLSPLNIQRMNNAIYQCYSLIDRQSQTLSESFYTLHMVENWLNLPPTPLTTVQPQKTSHSQRLVIARIKAALPQLAMLEETSVLGLPPCDAIFPDLGIILEVQGVYHYLDENMTLKNGRTTMKNKMYQRAGYRIIEVRVRSGQYFESDLQNCISILQAEMLARQMGKLRFY